MTEVIRVIVNSLPSRCTHCDFIQAVQDEHFGDYFFACRAHKRRDAFYSVIEDIETRPDWCPLVIVPVCIMNDIKMSQFLSESEED